MVKQLKKGEFTTSYDSEESAERVEETREVKKCRTRRRPDPKDGYRVGNRGAIETGSFCNGARTNGCHGFLRRRRGGFRRRW